MHNNTRLSVPLQKSHHTRPKVSRKASTTTNHRRLNSDQQLQMFVQINERNANQSSESNCSEHMTFNASSGLMVSQKMGSQEPEIKMERSSESSNIQQSAYIRKELLKEGEAKPVFEKTKNQIEEYNIPFYQFDEVKGEIDNIWNELTNRPSAFGQQSPINTYLDTKVSDKTYSSRQAKSTFTTRLNPFGGQNEMLRPQTQAQVVPQVKRRLPRVSLSRPRERPQTQNLHIPKFEQTFGKTQSSPKSKRRTKSVISNRLTKRSEKPSIFKQLLQKQQDLHFSEQDKLLIAAQANKIKHKQHCHECHKEGMNNARNSQQEFEHHQHLCDEFCKKKSELVIPHKQKGQLKPQENINFKDVSKLQQTFTKMFSELVESTFISSLTDYKTASELKDNILKQLNEFLDEVVTNFDPQSLSPRKKQTDKIKCNEFKFIQQLCQAKIQIRFEQFKIGNSILKELKYICNQNQDYIKKCLIHRELGILFKITEDYPNALKNYRKMLYLSWTQTGKQTYQIELDAYDGLAIVNFYIGNLEKAEFYYDRYMRGKVENIGSVIKRVAISNVMQQLDNKEQRITNQLAKKVKDWRQRGPSKLSRMPSLATQYFQNDKGEKKFVKWSNNVSLLPYYTVGQSQFHQKIGDTQTQNDLNMALEKMDRQNPPKESKCNTNFYSSELKYMNACPVTKHQFIRPLVSLLTPIKVKHKIYHPEDLAKVGVFKGQKSTIYKPFDNEELMKQVKNKRNGAIIKAVTTGQRNLSHLSKSRKGGRSSKPIRMIEDMREILKEYYRDMTKMLQKQGI